MSIMESATVWYAVAAWLTFLAVAVAGTYAAMQFRLMERDAYLRFLKNLTEAWESERLVRARKAVNQAVRPPRNNMQGSTLEPSQALKKRIEALQEEATEDEFYSLMQIPNFFEWVGILLKQYARDKRTMALDLFLGQIIYYFELYKPWIQQVRDRFKEIVPGIYIEFEELYTTAVKRRAQILKRTIEG